jgi:hypothetical protein
MGNHQGRATAATRRLKAIKKTNQRISEILGEADQLGSEIRNIACERHVPFSDIFDMSKATSAQCLEYEMYVCSALLCSVLLCFEPCHWKH